MTSQLLPDLSTNVTLSPSALTVPVSVLRGALADVWSEGVCDMVSFCDVVSCWANAVTPITNVNASKQTITFLIECFSFSFLVNIQARVFAPAFESGTGMG